MAEKKGKRPFRNVFPPRLSIKEMPEDEFENDDGEETDDYEEWSNSSSSGDCSEWSENDGHDETDEDNDGDDYDEEDEDDEEEEEEDEDEDEDDDEESLFNRVIFLLKEGSDLEDLKLKESKAYLRKYGLRIAGTKAVCIQRIIEHWRIKDGSGEKLFPKSSFIINCTGDVCRGDVVLFTQRVYEKFNKVRRHGRLLGKRTVAGRVVKESYGAAKQQHTFTVEVLWSKGIKKLQPLFPLLVKGRNLYKLKTFRQRWNNEAERCKILAEKHKRGTAARLVRAMKKRKKPWSDTENGGIKRQKHVCRTKPHQIRKSTEAKGKDVKTNGMALSGPHAMRKNLCRVASHPRQMSGNPRPRTSNSTLGHPEIAHVTKAINQTRPSHNNPLQNLYGSQRQFNHGTEPFYDIGSTLSSFNHGTHNFYSQSSYEHEARNLKHRSSYQFPLGREAYGQRKNSFQPISH